MQVRLIKSLSLIIGGSLLSSAVSIFVQKGTSTILGICLLITSLILILFGFDIISMLIHRLKLSSRKKQPRIGILNDMGWKVNDDQIQTWTDISPMKWKKQMERSISRYKINKKIKVKLIKTTENFDSYSAILNPYGGVYPEQDLVNFKTLDKIFRYVQERGLFINVTDIPGYWAFHPLLGRRVDATPPIWIYQKQDNSQKVEQIRPFINVPWAQKLGLIIDSENKYVNIEIPRKYRKKISIPNIHLDRAAIVEKNVIPKYKFRSNDNSPDKTPIFFIKYSEGKFLISLISISGQTPDSKKVLLKKCIVNLILLDILGK